MFVYAAEIVLPELLNNSATDPEFYYLLLKTSEAAFIVSGDKVCLDFKRPKMT